MQRRHALRDDQWDRIKDALPGKSTDPGQTGADNRLFVEAVIWIAKQVTHGETYRRIMTSGQMSTKDLCVGQKKVFANDL